MHEVYRAYDADGRLLYIGHTKNTERRWDGHKKTAMWRSYCFKIITKEYVSKAEAVAVEKRAIRMLAPLYNSQNNKKRWDKRKYERSAKVRPRGRPETVRRWRRDGYPGLWD